MWGVAGGARARYSLAAGKVHERELGLDVRVVARVVARDVDLRRRATDGVSSQILVLAS
eukprot:COSAG05_NODE_801_length_7224_cov_4.552000_1_plen_59_part_00